MRSLLDLVAQMALQVEPDAGKRIDHLTAQRDAIDAEIERLRGGSVPPLDDRLLREQFLHFASLARELLGDFRQVEDNFRALDRSVRESIAGWTGAKGSLVGEILGARESIEESDQGQSFRSFWELLMSQSRQDQLNADLGRVLDHPALGDVGGERGLRTIHYDWLDVDELFSQHFVDAARIVQHIVATLLDLGQVSLIALCERMPVQNGLAEVVTFLQLGHERFDVVVDDTVRDTVEWRSDGRSRSMSLPRVVFVA